MRFWFGKLTGSDLEVGVFLDELPESQFQLDFRSKTDEVFIFLSFSNSSSSTVPQSMEI
jgi:hypothetical protein